MSFKILTKNGVDNTNIDGARENHFSAGMRSGIVKGALNEGNLFLSSSNTIALNTCELIISGHRVIIDSVEYVTLSNAPTISTQKILIAEIVVDDTSIPTFRLFVENSTYRLVKDNLYKNINGKGTYQIEIYKFTHKTDGTIDDIFRTIDFITGGSGNAGTIEDIPFNASAISLSSDSQPTANIDYNEETKEYDFVLGIPKGAVVPNTLTIGNVVGGETASANITGTAPHQILNLVLPKGEKGDKGEQGKVGATFTYDQSTKTLNIITE